MHLGYMCDSCRLGSQKVKNGMAAYAMAEWSCEIGMGTNVGTVNNIYPVVLNMIPLRAALAACTTYSNRNDSRRVS